MFFLYLSFFSEAERIAKLTRTRVRINTMYDGGKNQDSTTLKKVAGTCNALVNKAKGKSGIRW
jgi:hypothetical protein